MVRIRTLPNGGGRTNLAFRLADQIPYGEPQWQDSSGGPEDNG
jgi:hypothetical protein